MVDSNMRWFTVKSAPDYEISLRGGVRRVDTKEPVEAINGYLQLDTPDGGQTWIPVSDLTELLIDSSTEVQLIDVVSKYPDILPTIVEDFMEEKGAEVVGE